MRTGQAQTASLGHVGAALVPAGSRLHLVQAFTQAAGVDLQIVDGAVRNREQIGAPHGKGIEAQGLRHGVEHGLEGMAHVDRTMTAHGAVRWCVGIDAQTVVAAGRQLVHRVQQGAGVQNRHQAVAGVGPAALHHLAVNRLDDTAAGQANLQTHVGFGPAPVRDEGLLARELQLDRALGSARQQGSDDLEIEGLGAVPETTTDKGFDDADLRSIEVHALRQNQVHVVRHLRHRVQRQAATFAVPTGQRGVGLHHGVRHFGVMKTLLQHQIRCGEATFDITKSVVHITRNIAGLIVVQLESVGGTRAGGIKAGGQFFQIEHDGVQRSARGRLVHRGHSGDRLATVAHAPTRQRKLVLCNRYHAIGHVALIAGDDGSHAGQRARPAEVDGANAGMCQRAAQNGAHQRLTRGQIRRVERLPRHLFDAVDQRLAHANGQA